MIAYFKEVFSVFDKKGEGTIKTKYLKNVLKCLGQKPSHQDIDGMLNEIHLGGKKEIGFDDFLTLVTKKMKQANEADKFREVFRMFDKEEKGFISACDLQYVMTNLGERLTDGELNNMMKEADTDGDGCITYDKFVTMMKSI